MRPGPASLALTVLLGLVQVAGAFWSPRQALFSQPFPRRVITHEGPLVLRGNQVYTIENVTFIQHGPIEVYDVAQLIIRDSTVEFVQSEIDRFGWRLLGSAKLVLEGTTARSLYEYHIRLSDSARAEVTSNSLLPNTVVTLDGAASLFAAQSDIRMVWVFPGRSPAQSPSLSTAEGAINSLYFTIGGETKALVTGLRPGNLTWTLREVGSARMHVELRDTRVTNIGWYMIGRAQVTFDDCHLSQVGVQENAIVALRNSRVVSPVMVFRSDHHIRLRKLISGIITHWSLHEEDPGSNVPFELLIDNSQIGGWLIQAGGQVTLEDCDLSGASRLQPAENSTLRAVRTYVREFWSWWGNGTVVFRDSVVGYVQSPADSTRVVTGTVCFEKKVMETWNGPWRRSTITREFPVRVIQTNGAPLAGLPLRLYDPDGKEVWSGRTGADGQASFQIVFTDTNYEKTWSLRFGTGEPPVTVPVRFLSDTPLEPPIPLNSSPSDTAALRGKYHFVQLLASAPGGETRTLGGALEFNGEGSYTFPPEKARPYWVRGAGEVALVSPIRPEDWLSAYLSADGHVLLGSSTFTADTNYDFFVAVRAPTGNATNALFNGSYSGAWFELTSGATQVVKSGLVSLVADGKGQFSRVMVTGHASDQGGRTVNQMVAGATYNLDPDGSGTVAFGSARGLLSGDWRIFVSKDGTYLVGHLPDRGVLVAAKSPGAAANFEGRYWTLGLSVESSRWTASSGSLRTLAAGRAMVAERRRLYDAAQDYAGLRSYVVKPDGTGALAASLPEGLANLRLVAPMGPVEAPRAGAFIGAEIGPLNQSSTRYGIFLGVRVPAYYPTGVFLDPGGVANGASFTGLPYPLAPGAIVSLFGSNLAAREARAAGFPLPSKLDDVTVTANGEPAPLYFVSPTQITIQLPYGLAGNWVTLRLSNARGASNEVVAPLAPTSPGVFSRPDGRPVVLHADYSLVGPENPARVGETLMIWLTGLGDLSPRVRTGDANPAAPVARAVYGPIKVLFGGVPAASVDFAGGAPGFAGLCQINATIPANSPVGPAVPLAISTSNAYTELVEIPIIK